MARFVLSLDQGTTSTRAIVFDAHGASVASAQREHRQIFPASGHVEHDPEEIWARTNEVIAEALSRAGAAPGDLASLGITNQRETLVVWHRDTGRAYHNAIVWQDVRGAALCESLAAASPRAAERFRAQTGLPLVPYFTASKLAWCLENVPGLREDAEKGVALAGTIDSFLVWRLTRPRDGGGAPLHVTDVTNASRTLLFNIHTLAWDAELCRAFKVPMAMLPRVLPSSHVYGTCAADSVLPGVSIGGILGDQQAALFGQVCFSPGDAKNTYGTGCFLLMNVGSTPPSGGSSGSGLLTTIAYQVGSQPPVYALEGSVAVAGAAVTWLRDNLGLIASPRDLEALAASVPDTAGAVFVPAFNGLFAPHWRADARGVLVGLSGAVTRAHIARATLEAVAHQSRELLDAMRADAGAALARGGSAGRELKVDGGMTANALLMQLQADLTGRRVVVPCVAETTALGAAYAAGLAVGFWGSLDELKTHWKEARAWEPAMGAALVLRSTRQWERALARSVGWMPLAAAAAAADPALALMRPPAVKAPSRIQQAFLAAACVAFGVVVGFAAGRRQQK